jgi:CO/xanthine dehydrogenase FAD-binding subunit
VSEADAIEFGRVAASEARPIDDHRSTAEYRRHAIAVLSRRLLRRAFPNG